MGCLESIQCAICGAPFQPPLEHLLPHSTHQEASCSDLSLKHLDWLCHLRVVGRNPKTGHAYITGPGKASTFGWVSVQVGDDPNVPNARRDEGIKTIDLPTYLSWSSLGGSGESFAPYPVHCACFEIVERVSRSSRPGSTGVDIEVLRSAMQAVDSGKPHCLGRMRYFELGRSPVKQFWEDGDEVRARLRWLLNPLTPIEMSILRLMEPTKEISQPGTHVFTELPTEMLHQILDYIMARDLVGLLIAAPALGARLDAPFWRCRIAHDMPYLWEMAQSRGIRGGHGEDMAKDWRSLHRQLLEESEPGLRVVKGGAVQLEPYTSIASRTRIWRCAEQLISA